MLIYGTQASGNSGGLLLGGLIGGVQAMAWSPDGASIASGGDDATAQVWNASTGEQLFVYMGHSSPVASVAWSPDGSRIASGSGDKTVQVWRPT